MPIVSVTMPGAASAAVGVSSMAATKICFSFMASSSLEVERGDGTSVPQVSQLAEM
jgi:hypothetical protein